MVIKDLDKTPPRYDIEIRVKYIKEHVQGQPNEASEACIEDTIKMIQCDKATIQRYKDDLLYVISRSLQFCDSGAKRNVLHNYMDFIRKRV